MRKSAFSLYVTLILLSVSTVWPAAAAVDANDPGPRFGSWGFDLSGMKQGAPPGADFYIYANGGWADRTSVPADRLSVGSFADLRFDANLHVLEMLDSFVQQPSTPDSSSAKAAALYRSFLDEARVETAGSTPLSQVLSNVRAARNRSDLAEIMGRSFSGFGGSIFDIDLAYDSVDPTRYSVHIGQGGLGMPDRDYYLEQRFAKEKVAYQLYIAKVLHLAGWANADVAAQSVVAFETQIAAAGWTHQQLRDLTAAYNPEPAAKLASDAPGFDWPRFLMSAGLADQRRIILTTKSAIPTLARLYAGTSLDTLKAWETFHIADSAAPYLSSAFVQTNFEFRKHVMAGQATPAPRWRRGVDLVNETMGSAVGELYVARYFSPESAAQMAVLTANVRDALRARIEGLTWMAPSTKAEALRKLAKQEIQIGRPRSWIDYTPLQIRSDDLFGNVMRAKAFDWSRRVGQLNGTWNKSDWRFWPQYPTAYTENNQLIFTAAMLQPPYFDPRADAAVNYGAIGAVIGHELTHNFDDQGRQEDAEGRLRDWWTPADADRFAKSARMLADQYSAIEPLPGLHVKGDLTLGENIADLGGVTIALSAYHASLAKRVAPVLDGFTGDQRVFLGWAQGWREKRSDDNLRQLLTTDVHSPGPARVNGVVRNIDGWYPAFSVRPGDTLYLPPAARVHIW